MCDETSSRRPHAASCPGTVVRWIVRGLALVALAGSSFLAWLSLQAGDAGGGCAGLAWFDCEDVLAGRWASWLGLPISLAAVGTYAAVFTASWLIGPRTTASVRRWTWIALCFLLASAIGAALWFIVLMALVIHKACIYCLAVHTCGLCIAVLLVRNVPWRRESAPEGVGLSSAGIAIAAATAGLAVLIGGQIFFPPGLKVEQISDLVDDSTDTPGGGGGTTPDPAPDGPLRKSGPVLPPDATATQTRGVPGPNDPRFADGVLMLDPWNHPIVGNPDAPHVVVKLFDYSCHQCRQLHRHLEKARGRYGDQLAIVVIPVPINTDCNEYIEKTHRDHVYACDYARLSLAVWRLAPQEFVAYHDWLMGTIPYPSLLDATIRAEDLVGRDALKKERDSAAVAEALGHYVRLFGQIRGAVPKLIFDGRHVISRFNRETLKTEEVIELLEEKTGIEPADADDP